MPSLNFETLVSKACNLHEPNAELLRQAELDHRTAVIANLFDPDVLHELNIQANPHEANPLCLLRCFGQTIVVFVASSHYIIGIDSGETDQDGDGCVTPIGPVPAERLQRAVLQIYAGMRLKASLRL